MGDPPGLDGQGVGYPRGSRGSEKRGSGPPGGEGCLGTSWEDPWDQVPGPGPAGTAGPRREGLM